MEKDFNKRQIGLLKDVQLAQEVCELYYVQNLQVSRIVRQTGCSRSRVYRIINNFALETPDLVESMKKRKEVSPGDYDNLKREIAQLKANLKREKLRADFYEEMVAFGKEVYGIDLKKAGTKKQEGLTAGIANSTGLHPSVSYLV